jgi:hypothetical protein
LRKKLISNTTSFSGECGVKGGRGEEKVPRRSVTVIDDNNSKITRTRGYMMSNDIDVTYATVLNLLIDLGYKTFMSPWSEETKETFRRYLRDTYLVEEGALDEVVDIFNKRLRHEALKRYEEEHKITKTVQQ